MAAPEAVERLTAAGAAFEPADIRRGRVAFAILAVGAFCLIVYLGLGMTFFADEWAFIESRSLGDPSTWWAPHNEHWSTLPILLYRLMVETVGIGSYVPYLVVVAAIHTVVAGLVYLLLERTSGPLFAVAGSAIILLFGSGFENLYWGFQTGFLGSLAFGLAAMLVTDLGPTPRRAALVAGLLLASLATQGIGIVMAVVVGVAWLLNARWRRWIPVLAIPAAVYATWYVVAGREGVAVFRSPFSMEALLDVSPSILRGLSNAFGSITGIPLLGLLVVAVLATWGSRTFLRDGIHPLAVATVTGIAVQYALIGAARGHLFDGVIDYTRYTYVAGVLAMIAVGALLGPARLPDVGRPRLVGLALIGSWLALALVVNVGLLVAGRELFLDRADMTRALVQVALDPRPDGVVGDRSLVLVPSPNALGDIVAAYGDPRTDALVPWAVRPVPPHVLAEARRRLIEGAPLPGFSE
jgi:hypothetical protein